MGTGRVCQALFGVVLALVVLLGNGLASAHHSSSTSRVGGASDFRRVGVANSTIAPPRLDAAMAYDLLLFDRVLQGSDTYDKAQFGSVLINFISVSLGLELASSTSGALRIPFGIVVLNPVDGAAETSVGLGDVHVTVGQELFSLFDRAGTLPMSLRVRVGLVVPTGRYEPDASLSLTDVSGSADGSIDLVTYNARASMGAGVWSFLAAAELDWRVHDSVSLQLSAAVLQPASATSDNIRWGTDAELGGLATIELIRDALMVRGHMDYRFHSRDDVQQVVDEMPGMVRRERVGGRDEIGLGLGVEARPGRGFTCSVRGRIPAWQQVGGIQLVETVSTTVSCAFAMGI